MDGKKITLVFFFVFVSFCIAQENNFPWGISRTELRQYVENLKGETQVLRRTTDWKTISVNYQVDEIYRFVNDTLVVRQWFFEYPIQYIGYNNYKDIKAKCDSLFGKSVRLVDKRDKNEKLADSYAFEKPFITLRYLYDLPETYITLTAYLTFKRHYSEITDKKVNVALRFFSKKYKDTWQHSDKPFVWGSFLYDENMKLSPLLD